MLVPVVQVRPVGVAVFQRRMFVFVIVTDSLSCTIRVGMGVMRVGVGMQVGMDLRLVPVSVLVGFLE